MLKNRGFFVVSAIVLCSLPAWAQEPPDSQQLFSPLVSQKFYEIAFELAGSEQLSESQAQEAIILLTAARNLDTKTSYIISDMIKLVCRYPRQEYTELMRGLLTNYLDRSADLEIVRKAVQYLLEQLNSREEREKLLQELLTTLGNKNAFISSELSTMLGLLTAEKADSQRAQSYFMQAYKDNKYNRLAFEKLAELAPKQIGPSIYLEHLRLRLSENPLNLEAAVNFARYAEQLELYETAAQAYEYCANLFGYLYPAKPIPVQIYLRWIISNYNTQRNQHSCLQLAKNIRESGVFDLILESIAAKAANKAGDAAKATEILQTAENKVQQFLMDVNHPQEINAEQLAWFYCFGKPDADKALDWANKAYSIQPKSAMTASILAYALVMNQQISLAKSLIENYERNQIGDLALAEIYLSEGKQDLAIETLKATIIKDPGSLQAEQAKEMLGKLGSTYIPPIDAEIILTALKNSLKYAVVPAFTTPDKMLSVELNIRGSKFSYDNNFGATLIITNNLSEPLIISDDSLFSGNIRIDAKISGDLNKTIPNLVSIKTQPALQIEPGRSFLIPVQLFTADLRQTLLTYPQASLNIDFTVYIDPVADKAGTLANRLPVIKSPKVTVQRPKMELTAKYLQNRVNSLSKGGQGQKMKTAELFVSLLMEQLAMANREPLYKFMYADWMPDMLKSALTTSLDDADWNVRANVMAVMISLPMDYTLVDSAAQNLYDTHWPVRMMAIVLLAKHQGSNFNKVLDWTAKYDANKLVRDMAIALGASIPQTQKAAGASDSNSIETLPAVNKK